MANITQNFYLNINTKIKEEILIQDFRSNNLYNRNETQDIDK